MIDKKDCILIDKNDKVVYTQPFSILRILTNTSINVVLILLEIALLSQYLLDLTTMLLPTIFAQIADLIAIIVITIYDYKFSAFYITSKKVIYIVPTQRQKKWLDCEFKDIKELYTSSNNLIIITKDNIKHKIECLNKPKNILNIIKKEIEKNQ